MKQRVIQFLELLKLHPGFKIEAPEMCCAEDKSPIQVQGK